MTENRIFDLAGENRLLLADVLDGLSDEQWTQPTLCAGWTVHHLAGHLVQARLVGFGRFFLAALRHRGDTERTVDHLARTLARRPRHELTALLREHARDRVDPPRIGPMGPFTDTCVHLRDIARPLALEVDVPAQHWRLVLDYLTSARAAAGLVPPGRLAGLRLRASDDDWASTTGGTEVTESLVTGPLEALAMAATGRAVALEDLTGPGVRVLGERLDPR